METVKKLELTGHVGWDEKSDWSLSRMFEHLKAETPSGWVVDRFRVIMSPPPSAVVGRPEKS